METKEQNQLVHKPAEPLQQISEKRLIEYLEAFGLVNKIQDKEKKMFLEIAKTYNLNPFKREIYISAYGEGASRQLAILTGYEVYIKRAERSGLLDGWKCWTEGSVEEKNLVAKIMIHRKDRKIPFEHEVEYSEYVQLKDGKPNKFWMKAKTMIKKVVMAQGFRLCFNDELGGMPYANEEMPESKPMVEDAVYAEESKVTTAEKVTATVVPQTKHHEEFYKMVMETDLLDDSQKKTFTEGYLTWSDAKVKKAIEKLKLTLADIEKSIEAQK